VLKSLKDKGFTSYKLRRDKLFGEATIQKIRKSELVSWENINTICNLLDCQPGDILLYESDSNFAHD
jgi:Predicted transcriptional regulator